MLELSNISKSYKTNRILNNVNLKVNDGEMIALLGPSGSGKTTILRLIAGFIEADEGEILVDNININTIEAHKRNIGVVFQDYALFPHMTVEQNVEFGLKMRKIPQVERKERVKEALSIVGLDQYGTRYPKQLSGGQQQRVAIARVVAIRANVMLLDEPLSNLDAKLRRQVRVEIKELQQKLKITTLIVTHDQEEAMTMGDRIAILEDGRIQQIGTPMSLYERPGNMFVAGFLGTPSINFMDFDITDSDNTIEGSSVPSSILNKRIIDKLPKGSYILGVRPENLVYLNEKCDNYFLKAKVTLVEHLGAETLIYFCINDRIYCCRTGFDSQIKNGKDAYFNINFEKVSIFDKNTKMCIFPNE